MNELVSYFKTKTSLDIYYQAGTGEISNQMLKEFVSHRTSFFGLFKNKVVKKPTDEPILFAQRSL